jgi:hypothetical protein
MADAEALMRHLHLAANTAATTAPTSTTVVPPPSTPLRVGPRLAHPAPFATATAQSASGFGPGVGRGGGSGGAHHTSTVHAGAAGAVTGVASQQLHGGGMAWPAATLTAAQQQQQPLWTPYTTSLDTPRHADKSDG